MDERVLHELAAQRGELHARWEVLLRVEPVKSPLGRPEALKHMIDYTLGVLFVALQEGPSKRKVYRSLAAEVAEGTICPCGRNPWLAYFVAGEQALLETLVLVQAKMPDCSEARASAVRELKQAFAQVAHREIETFCAVCQFREQAQHALPYQASPLV